MRVETLTVASVKAETVYVKSASSATRTLTKYDTLRLTTAETLTVHLPGRVDSQVVFVPRSVADTVASVCRRLLTDCGRVHVADSALVVGLRAELLLKNPARPSVLNTIASGAFDGGCAAGGGALGAQFAGVKGAAIGSAASYLLCRLLRR